MPPYQQRLQTCRSSSLRRYQQLADQALLPAMLRRVFCVLHRFQSAAAALPLLQLLPLLTAAAALQKRSRPAALALARPPFEFPSLAAPLARRLQRCPLRSALVQTVAVESAGLSALAMRSSIWVQAAYHRHRRPSRHRHHHQRQRLLQQRQQLSRSPLRRALLYRLAQMPQPRRAQQRLQPLLPQPRRAQRRLQPLLQRAGPHVRRLQLPALPLMGRQEAVLSHPSLSPQQRTLPPPQLSQQQRCLRLRRQRRHARQRARCAACRALAVCPECASAMTCQSALPALPLLLRRRRQRRRRSLAL